VLILSFPRINCLGHETDHSPPSNAKVRNERSYVYLQSLIIPLWHVQGTALTFTVTFSRHPGVVIGCFSSGFHTKTVYTPLSNACGTCSTCHILHNCHSNHTVDVKSKFDSNTRVNVEMTCNDSQVRTSNGCNLHTENVRGVLQVVVSLWMYIIFTVARYIFLIRNDTWLLVHTVVSFSLNYH